MGSAFNYARTSAASWDAFADVDAVLAELSAMEADGTKPARSGELWRNLGDEVFRRRSVMSAC
jgi:hypothetical protein